MRYLLIFVLTLPLYSQKLRVGRAHSEKDAAKEISDLTKQAVTLDYWKKRREALKTEA